MTSDREAMTDADVDWIVASFVAENAVLAEEVARLRKALEMCVDAMEYGGIGGMEIHVDNRRLSRLLHDKRSSCREGDNREFWTFLINKLETSLLQARAALTPKETK